MTFRKDLRRFVGRRLLAELEHQPRSGALDGVPGIFGGRFLLGFRIMSASESLFR